MKNIKLLVLAIAMLACIASLVACQSTAENVDDKTDIITESTTATASAAESAAGETESYTAEGDDLEIMTAAASDNGTQQPSEPTENATEATQTEPAESEPSTTDVQVEETTKEDVVVLPFVPAQ